MTENLSASAELKRYKLAIEGSNICIWDWMDITKKEQWWSPRFYKILGYEKGEIDSNIDTFKKLLHPADQEHVFEALEKHFEIDETAVIEYRLQTKSGNYKWFKASAKVEFDNDGNPRRMAGNIVDINNRKQAELQVEQERKLLRTIIDNIPANVYVKNREGEKLLANKSGYQFWGLDKNGAIGKSDANQKEVAILSQNEDQRVLETGNTILQKETHIEINGEKYVLLISKIPLTDNNNEIIGLVSVSNDITQRRQMIDQLQQRNEELKNLNETTNKIYSVIGHDLKTPLTSILGITDLMLNGIEELDENELLTDNLKIIHQASLKMSDLLKDLLKWAHLQTGDLSLNKKKFPITETIEDTIDLLSIAAEQKEISIHFNSDDPLEVYADEQLIATIIRNFISNAIKFSTEGDTVKIEFDRNAEQWQVSVCDQGVGMSKATQEKLFDDQEHPNQHGTDNEKGSGIGLRLCQKLANMHNGTIDVKSELGEGSTFTLYIPHTDSP